MNVGIGRIKKEGLVCQNCSICAVWEDSKEAAIKKWNTRVEDLNMGEFTEISLQFSRMCKKYKECTECPMNNLAYCNKVKGNLTFKDFKDAETVITQWAKENPEPQYPSWLEWLHTQLPALNGAGDHEAIRILFNNHIPVDIAEKLRIKPKETYGKYIEFNQ